MVPWVIVVFITLGYVLHLKKNPFDFKTLLKWKMFIRVSPSPWKLKRSHTFPCSYTWVTDMELRLMRGPYLGVCILRPLKWRKVWELIHRSNEVFLAESGRSVRKCGPSKSFNDFVCVTSLSDKQLEFLPCS